MKSPIVVLVLDTCKSDHFPDRTPSPDRPCTFVRPRPIQTPSLSNTSESFVHRYSTHNVSPLHSPSFTPSFPSEDRLGRCDPRPGRGTCSKPNKSALLTRSWLLCACIWKVTRPKHKNTPLIPYLRLHSSALAARSHGRLASIRLLYRNNPIA